MYNLYSALGINVTASVIPIPFSHFLQFQFQVFAGTREHFWPDVLPATINDSYG